MPHFQQIGKRAVTDTVGIIEPNFETAGTISKIIANLGRLKAYRHIHRSTKTWEQCPFELAATAHIFQSRGNVFTPEFKVDQCVEQI